MPVLAAVGGMIAPAAVYLVGAMVLDRPEIARGWAIPCATDIAFSYLVARLVFRPGHPAIPFLLLLAIADDAMGLIILAVAYPSGPLAMGQLALWFVPALALAWTLRKSGVTSFWAYLLGPGVMSWFALYIGGIHPALALVPIVPFMPHDKVPRLLFGGRTAEPAATMDDFEHWWRVPVQFVLLIFGLANAGVPLSSVGTVTGLVIAGLVIGKPLGIIGTTLVADRLGFERADDLDYRALLVLGIAAGIGFTVALFFTTAAFPPGVVLNEAKMGALLSFFAAPLAIVVARLLRIKRS